MPTETELYDAALNHFAENDLEGAVNAFKELIDTYPDYIEGYLGLGHAYERLSLYDEAIEAVQKAIAIDPKDPLAYTSLSICYQRKEMIQEAEDAMAKSQELQLEASRSST